MAAPNNSNQFHPRQNSSSFRRSSSAAAAGGRAGVERQQIHSRILHHPPSLPIFSNSDDTATIMLSSKSSSTSGGGSGSGNASGDRRKSKHDKTSSTTTSSPSPASSTRSIRRSRSNSDHSACKALCKKAQMENDSMVYLGGPQVYTCGQCRTHLTSHDDIISKSFHGRHGRAYLFDQCVNVTTGPPEDRILITGLHSVSDIFCKRCHRMVGWTYDKAYEPSQKYKEGKFIIEKINLHLEESDYYEVERPAGERADKWRVRSMSWGSERSLVGCSSSFGADGGMSVGSPGGLYTRSRSGSRDVSWSGSGVGMVGGRTSPSSPRPSSGSASSAGYSSPLLNHHPSNRITQSPSARRIMPPMSPRSPNDIVYEYRNDD